ncbi:MAG: PilZ domain-containing protein [Oscillospiraceae bacterium]|nr:PilZ domain-containing protein [Oscillospiraceae bacterium]MDE6840128.1 PilZ domain-containing protein [Oscillospiraceae bacterium]
MNQTPDTEEQAVQANADNDFGLRPGMTVEVLTMENRLTFVGRVERVRNGAVTIREAKGDQLPPVLYNKEIKLRFFREPHNFVLHGKICGSTNLIWKLDRLESKFSKEQRAFFRQRISPNTAASCAKRAVNGRPGTKPAPCHVMDISAGGILLTSAETYEVGDRLSVTGIRLARGVDPFSFNCQIRRAGERDMGIIRYGCQFEAISPKEQDRLLRAIFIVQREEIRNQKERDDL